MFYGTIKEDFSTQLGFEKKRPKIKERNDSKKKDANGPSPDRIPLPAALVIVLFCLTEIFFY